MLEPRRLLSTTVTLAGTPGGDAFLAQLDAGGTHVQFYANSTAATGTPVQTVAVADLAKVVVNGGAGADTFTVHAAGANFQLDASSTTGLAVDVEQGSVALTTSQSFSALTVGSAATVVMSVSSATVNVGTPGVTVNGLFNHAAGSLVTPLVTVTGSGTFLDAGGIVTGSGTTALVVSNGGLFDAATNASLAGVTGSFYNAGTYRVDNGGIGSATTTLSMAVVNSAGAVDVTAGTLSVPGSIVVADGGTLALNGPGTISIPSFQDTDGTVTQTAGTLAVAGSFAVTGIGSGVGTYTISGGTLTAGNAYVGAFGVGYLYQTGGVVGIGHTEIGSFGYGFLVQSGGTATYADTYLGFYGGGQATFTGGTTIMTGVVVGDNGWGSITVGGTANLTTASEELGRGTGSFGAVDQTGGTHTTGGLTVGSYGGGTGVYNLSGGTLYAAAEILSFNYLPGPVGSGTFTQTGGANVDGGVILEGYGNSIGTYTLSAGIFTANGICVGILGQGVFTQTGGIATSTGFYIAGYYGPSSTVTMTGGTLSVAGNSYIGYYSDATFSQSGGTVSVPGDLYVSGDGTDGDQAGDGTYNLSNTAVLTTARTFVGYSKDGTFNQSGGTHTTGALVLDGPSGTVGTYDHGGTLNATTTVNVLTPSAGGSGVVDEGDPYTLNLSGTSSVGNNAINSWLIGWGDGSTNTPVNGNPPSVIHTYVDGGNTYTITPTAYGGGMTYPGAPSQVLVNDVPAQIQTLSNQTVATGGTLSVSTPFTDPGINQTRVATITWGDGSTTPATVVESGGTGTVSGSHVYAAHGTYHATVQVTDDKGAVGRSDFDVVVHYVTPTLNITLPPTSDAGQPVTIGLHDPGPEVTGVGEWTVDWGDGTTTHVVDLPTSVTATEAVWNVTHTYATAGTYTVSASAGDSAGWHAVSGGLIDVTDPPVAPTDLTATVVSSGEIDLSWVDQSAAAVNDVVYVSTDGGTTYTPLDQVAPVAAGSTNYYAATGLNSGTTYWFTVASADATTTTPVSAPASGTTGGIPSPAGLSATAAGPNQVGLSWADPAGLATSFTVQRSADGGTTFETIGTVAASAADAYTDTTAVDGTDYQFQVVGNRSALTSNPTDPAEVVTPVATPTNLTAVSTDGTDVVLNWSDPSQAPDPRQFEVDRRPAGSTGDADWAMLTQTDPGVFTYTDGTLTGLTGYSYRVQAFTPTASSAFTTPTTLTTPLAVPADPTGLTAGSSSPTSVDLSWDAPTTPQNAGGDRITSYDLEVSADEGRTFAEYKTGTAPSALPVAAGATSVTVTGLTPTKVYLFELSAVNAAGESSTDGPVGARTTALVPVAPTDLVLESVTPNGDVLTWADANTDETGADDGDEVWRLDPGAAAPIAVAQVDPGVDTFTDKNLTAGARYTYTVRAWKVGGYALFSKPVVVNTPPGDVPSLTSVTSNPNQDYQTQQEDNVTLAFTAGSDLTSVQVEYRNTKYADDSWTHIGTDFPTAPGHVGYGLDIDTTYQFRIRGVTPAGPTAWSQPTTYATAAAQIVTDATVSNLTASASGTTINVSWANSSTDYAPYVSFSRGGGNDDDTGAVSNLTPTTGVITGAVPGATYYLQAYYGCQRSNEATVLVPGIAPPDGQPDNIWAFPDPSGKGVFLAWDQGSPSYVWNADTTIIQRSVDGVNYTDLNVIGAATSSYPDATALPDSAYFYRLCSATGGGAVRSGPTPAVRVDTPGVKITVKAPLDPAFNPDLSLNAEDANNDGIPDDEEAGPIPDEKELYQVAVDIPLGVDDCGNATLTWSSAIQLYKDDQKQNQIGTLNADGTLYSLGWKVGQNSTAQMFYAEATAGSTYWGDQSLQLSASLTLLTTTQPSSAPTTHPSTQTTPTDEGVMIKWMNASNASTGTDVLIGQKMDVSVSYQGPRKQELKKDKFQWAISGGKPFTSYAAAGAEVKFLAATDLVKRQFEFAWSQGGPTPGTSASQTVSCSGNINGFAFTVQDASASFNVWVPSYLWNPAPVIGTAAINNQKSPPRARLADGLTYNVPVVRMPFTFAKLAGVLALNQLVNPVTSGQNNGGPKLHVNTFDSGIGLDTQQFLNDKGKRDTWLTGNQPNVLGDFEPYQELKGVTSVAITESFITTLLFMPNKGFFVPLDGFTWSWSEEAALQDQTVDFNANTNVWIATNPIQTLGSPAMYPEFPAWKVKYSTSSTGRDWVKK